MVRELEHYSKSWDYNFDCEDVLMDTEIFLTELIMHWPSGH